MKRSAPRHPKVSELMGYLDINRPTAVGLLELLWHYTAQYSPAGDIGRFSDHVIAEGVCWDGNPEKLVDALIRSTWLDRCECHRLRVHDWPEHADQTVKRYLAKRNQQFCKCYADASMKLASCSSENSNANTNANAYTRDTRDHACASTSESKLTPQDDETRRKDVRAQKAISKIKGEVVPLESKKANEIAGRIRESWPDYPEQNVRETAAILVQDVDKVDVIAIIGEARKQWAPNRPVIDRWNGLHGHLVAWVGNRVKDAKEAQNGAQGPSPPKDLAAIESDIQGGLDIDPVRFAIAVNTAVENGDKILMETRLLIAAAKAAGNLEVRRTGKVDPLWTSPQRPAKIREPPGRPPTQEEISKMVAKIGRGKKNELE